MVRPVLEYASSVWDPRTLNNINKIEAVQRKAARFCLNEFSSVTSMLSTLNLPPLQQRREKAKFIMIYKIINDLNDIPKDYFTPNDPRLRKVYYRQLMTNIDLYKLFPSVIKLWNPLPLYS